MYCICVCGVCVVIENTEFMDFSFTQTCFFHSRHKHNFKMLWFTLWALVFYSKQEFISPLWVRVNRTWLICTQKHTSIHVSPASINRSLIFAVFCLLVDLFFAHLTQGVLHTVAGYLLYTSMTFKYVFDHHHDDVYWCTADIGWITGHSYITYGPLANGATSVLVSQISKVSHV